MKKDKLHRKDNAIAP